MAWKRACALDETEEGEGVRLETTPPIALFRTGDELFATDDVCTHDNTSLAEGYVDGTVVECPWHFAKFCLRTGKVLSPPATRSVATYPVKVEDGEVYVDIPA
jgi:nitrite reductase/ring-hydroxylating ferredoxin subunit